ncbi:MAG: STAS/SEC14 domain-containing protein [Alphaproteobacteria bacterium]
MTPLRKENLELEFNNNIAFMSVKGTMSSDSLNEGLAWMDQVAETNDNFNICVDMAYENFDGLGAARAEFLRVGRVLRHALSAEKCAVLTDSTFLQNSAKVEAAAIPGMEINAFGIEDREIAQKWLNDEPVIETATTGLDHVNEQIEAEAEVSQAELTANPWDNLNMSKVDV